MASIPLLRLSVPVPVPVPVPQSILKQRSNEWKHYSVPATSKIATKMMSNSSYTTTPASERLLSAASYFLPLANGLQYGRFLFQQFPILALPFQPLLPFLTLYRSLPYASFLSFFALYLGVARNPSFSRYARFNALQALLLDVLLVLPILFQRIFTPPSTGIALKLTTTAHNFLFLFLVSSFLYALASSILGKTPHLPFLSQAAERQL